MRDPTLVVRRISEHTLDEMSIGEKADQAAILRVTAQIPAAVAASRASAPAASAGSTVNSLGDFLDAGPGPAYPESRAERRRSMSVPTPS